MSVKTIQDSSDAYSASEFELIKENIERFSLTSFHDSAKVEEYAEIFGLKSLFETQKTKSKKDINLAVKEFEETPYEPVYEELCRLHWICLTRKVINTLEFGSGFSTVVLADAMRILKEHFGGWAQEKIRTEIPFHIYAVEEEQRFVEITKKRLGDTLAPYVTISRSSVDILLHDNRITTVFSQLPNISPDFIYLDGPSQHATTTDINGISLNTKVRMPMSSDILKFEFFLEPGTLILVDGRTANARFLKSYLRRNWAYWHDVAGDVHFFELQEEPLGPFNDLKMNFCLNGKWLIG
jgi:hypothetical protein